MDKIRFICHIEKQEPDQRRWWGKAYVYETEGEPSADHSGDIIDTPEAQAELEHAFYEYVKSSRQGDREHVDFGAASMIEGFIVTKEKIAAGLFPDGMDLGIYLGFEADSTEAGDLLWDGVKSGRLSSMSIVGEGVREPI